MTPQVHNVNVGKIRKGVVYGSPGGNTMACQLTAQNANLLQTTIQEHDVYLDDTRAIFHRRN